MNIRILLAKDRRIVREGLHVLLEKHPEMEVIAEAENGLTAVQLAKELKPDVVIMDIAMPDLNGIEATRHIVSEFPGIKVAALSIHSDRRFVTGMFKAGASGYLLKDCAFEELLYAIRTVVTNNVYLSPGIAGIVVEDYLRQVSGNELSNSPILTEREREVLRLIAEGKKTKQIASYFNVSVKTVETYRLQIMNKLNIRSIAELTKFSIREGLTSLETE